MRTELHLVPGEKVLWTGAPERHPFVDAGDVYLVPVALLFLGSVTVGGIVAVQNGDRFSMAYAITVHAAVLAFIVGRLVLRAVRRRSTSYTVTNRRVIEVSESPRPRRTEAHLRSLAPPVVRTDTDSGLGSVAFGVFPGFRDFVAELGIQRRRDEPRPIVLRHIRQPGRVRDLIAAAQH